MIIIRRNSQFNIIDGEPQFDRVRFLVEQDGMHYAGYSNNRRVSPAELSELDDLQEIRTKDRGPKPFPHWTIVPDESDYFIKKPDLRDYLDQGLEARMDREIEVCEVIKLNPHPGLATYYGCTKSDGRVSGICLKRYKESLADRVNPGHLNKFDFISHGRPLVNDEMRGWIGLIKNALEHLHSLGLVHNDVNPSNIMLDDNDQPIVIDFDSASRVGESLETVGRTYPWYDRHASRAEPANDLIALEEIETWLFGSAEDLKL